MKLIQRTRSAAVVAASVSRSGQELTVQVIVGSCPVPDGTPARPAPSRSAGQR